MKNLFKDIIDSFKYIPENKYNFELSDENAQDNLNSITPLENLNQNVYSRIFINLEYIKSKFNFDINSDIKIREFTLNANGNEYKSFLLFIDGMSDSKSINRFILNPLMLKNKSNSSLNTTINNHIHVKFSKKPDITDYIFSCLIPYNDVEKIKNFRKIISLVNQGNCALFIDTLDTCYVCDVKGFEKRNIDSPVNETVIRGSQEAFVESIRTNTSILRRLVNNENLIIEDTEIGVISNTKCAICYIKNIVNDKLINEVKHRVENLDIDYIISSGQLEELLKEHLNASLPEVLATERPDRASSSLLEGKVVLIVNGTPMALIVPCTFFDLLESPEDNNINYHFANLLKFIRFVACFFSILLPGLYIAITSFHEELIPTELLFSIISSREAVPMPIELEIIIMEIAFELIHEAGIRVPAHINSTMSIVGALVLGDAAVSANIVSPISIIIVAISGLTSFAIPNFSLELHFRILRFIFIFLGAAFGFLGISIGIFVYIAILSNYSSFGVPYLSPYVPLSNINDDGYFVAPLWKREKRNDYLNTKRMNKEAEISMKWKTNKN